MRRRSVDKPQPITERLLVGHPFQVCVFAPASYRRFVRLFRQTWKAVSLIERRRILKLWRKRGAGAGPLVEAGAFWSGDDDALATVTMGGHAMKFKPDLDLMPDDAAHDLIAHELAHVVQQASGWIREWMSDGIAGDVDSIIEEEADGIAGEWGFDMSALNHWKCEFSKAA